MKLNRLFPVRSTTSRPQTFHRQPRIERLADRIMLHGDGLCDHLDASVDEPQVAVYASYDDADLDRSADNTSVKEWDRINELLYPTAVPAYSSNPGAEATIYLDFNGNFEPGSWRGFEDIETPPFDLDGNPNTFSPREQAIIRDTYLAVAEDFTPFDINVTTVDPGDFSDGDALRVAIGGHAYDWYKLDHSSTPGGTSSRDAFTEDDPNVVFVFSELTQESAEIRDYNDAEFAMILANISSHEAGHGLGLAHQSVYDAAGNNIDNYSDGTDVWTPIMGTHLNVDRTTWHDGPTPDGADDLQDDMAVLAREENGFGYRADDHGNTMATATHLQSARTYAGTDLTASGIIHQTTDHDFFHFYSDGGQVTIDLEVAQFAANLDTRLELWSTNGGIVDPFSFTKTFSSYTFNRIDLNSSNLLPDGLLRVSDPTDDLGASITASLNAGDYYIAVNSHGTYGDVGQYTISVDMPDPVYKLVTYPYRSSILTTSDGGRTDIVKLSTSDNQLTSPIVYSAVRTTATTSSTTISSVKLAEPITTTTLTKSAAIDAAMDDFGKTSPIETRFGRLI